MPKPRRPEVMTYRGCYCGHTSSRIRDWKRHKKTIGHHQIVTITRAGSTWGPWDLTKVPKEMTSMEIWKEEERMKEAIELVCEALAWYNRSRNLGKRESPTWEKKVPKKFGADQGLGYLEVPYTNLTLPRSYSG